MWVGGKSLREIAEASFGDVEDESKRMTECCRMIFQRLTHGASWGLGALQTLAGIEYDKLSSEQRENLRTLPAMVYYGCETVEDVLMRTLAVPRQLCVSLGERYKQAIANKPTGEARLREARNWLSGAPAETWQEAAGPGKMSGADYRNVWRVLNGHQPEFG